MSLHKMW